MFDFLIIGAGFSGLTMAERLTTQLGKRCLVVDKRNHIGGNAYDHYDSHGVLIHTYGAALLPDEFPEDSLIPLPVHGVACGELQNPIPH